ncbi:hypothetical protein BGW37DRAFT_478644 [Umbelopsis sp. PMI_123]|nr:hypothetical protein BGW37DRAFT_478644 [Umbelopsis sp. PMI_123]
MIWNKPFTKDITGTASKSAFSGSLSRMVTIIYALGSCGCTRILATWRNALCIALGISVVAGAITCCAVC